MIKVFMVCVFGQCFNPEAITRLNQMDAFFEQPATCIAQTMAVPAEPIIFNGKTCAEVVTEINKQIKG